MHTQRNIRRVVDGGPRGRGGPRRGGRGPGGRRGRVADPPATTGDEVAAWFAGQLPDDWFVAPPAVLIDRDEIVVTGALAVPKVDGDAEVATATDARIEAFREDTRPQRMAIAERAQARFERHVTWAASCGESAQTFTHASVPVMTRLVMDERAVLDTLISAGVARSRSEALAWCVRLVGRNESEWIDKIREAMRAVEDLRSEGPDSAS